ncbi:WXG100 family type VII secretion target [Paenibacillus xylanexedens]|uniref:WXG100 family type VII secretion target n=1 Tax=Paenibacillus xylanexedens TaxID=528191 RepID=UPI0011A315E2|nr:WXG100 family type VII secretion target [Paenibacillus xylanexedens]
MSTIKVTPEQLHHVSNQVDQARQQLEHIQDNLSRQIMFLQAVWLGVTQERFYGDFARSRIVLQKALESMLYTSKELTEIATRFEQADAEKGSLGGVIGAVGAVAMMQSSGSDAGSEDKGYRMAQVNVFGRLVQMPVNEDGVTDQAALQAYQKDQGHLDFNQMQAVGTEESGEDIISLQIEAFENRIHPFTGEPVNDRYAQMMVTSLKFSQILMAFQMVRGSMPGRSGPFRTSSSGLASRIRERIDQKLGDNNKEAASTPRTVISPDMETKILEGQRKVPRNILIGGHSPNINNNNNNYAVEVIRNNADGTKYVLFTKQFEDGNISKLKHSTLFPDWWSEGKIIESIKSVGDTPAISSRLRDRATWHRGKIDGVEIDVIKDGNNLSSGYPTGESNAPYPAGF